MLQSHVYIISYIDVMKPLIQEGKGVDTFL